VIGTNTEWHFLEGTRPRSFKPAGKWQCNSGVATAEAVVAGMGICQLPLFYVQSHLMRDHVVPLLGSFKAEPEPIWAVYPRRRHLQPKIRHLVDLLELQLQNAIDVFVPPQL
jgi:DNA-binding transcriptional LysR family regulator